jgi:competence protein ComEA
MLPEKIREYFSFTKKERVGIIILIVLIIIIFILPEFFSAKKSTSNRQQFEQFKNEIAQLKTQQDSVHNTAKHYEPHQEYHADYNEPLHNNVIEKSTLFYFDPNTVSNEEWKKLGLRDRTINTIQHYVSKGGKFHKPDDLKKIYGLHDDEYNRLLPFVRIKNNDAVNVINKTEKTPFSNSSFHKTKEYSVVDINAADTSALTALPGIGSKLANRIINFRERLGGFYNVDQVGETYGLPDSTFLKIKSWLKITASSVKKININTADANTLKQHPYIKWNLANAIVQYRQQHGEYKSPGELQQIAIITPEIYAKISPYLVTN